MSLGTTPDSILYVILLGFGLLVSLGVVMALVGLIQRVARIRNEWFGLVAMLVIYVGGLMGFSLYLDSVGQVRQGVIGAKTETIEFRKEGDWSHNYGVNITYQADSGDEALSHFNTTEKLFDALHEGEPVELRTVSINGWFDLTRLADQTTWDWINWRWMGYGLGALALIYLGWKSLKSKTGCLAMVALLALLACIPFGLKYQEWRTSQDDSRTPLHARGVVEEIHHVTTIDPLPSDYGGGGDRWETEIDVAQLYDIVVVRYTPQSYSESILGVDAVDSIDGSLEKGMTVELAYSAEAPRTVRLPNRTRNHHIRNPLEWLKQQAFALGLVGLILVGVMLLERWGRRWLSRARASQLRRLR
ncbi:MAG: hypothetical protein R2911_33325 [Caldilineaceae bacterium]